MQEMPGLPAECAVNAVVLRAAFCPMSSMCAVLCVSGGAPMLTAYTHTAATCLPTAPMASPYCSAYELPLERLHQWLRRFHHAFIMGPLHNENK